MPRKSKSNKPVFVVKRKYAGSYVASYGEKKFDVSYYEVDNSGKGKGLSNYWGWKSVDNYGYPEDAYYSKKDALNALKNHLGI